MANLKLVGHAIFALAVVSCAVTMLRAQGPEVPASAVEQSSRQTVPALVRYQGSISGHSGERAFLRFSIFATEQSREPLWSETQSIQLGAEGEFTVMLGAGSSFGLPQSLFVDGEPRWISIQVNGQDGPRSLLSSVPYAMKSADAQTLAGQPAAAFVTQDELAAKLASTPSRAGLDAVLPQVSPTGSGTTGNLAMWTSSTALGASAMTQTGSGTAAKFGIRTTVPATALDVNGPSTFRSNLFLFGRTATATAGANSPPMQFRASSFMAGGAAVAQNFAWQAIATGNNTATPSANLSLLFGTAALVPTGLSIASNGVLTFAPGQTFPGTGPGTITSVTAGTDLTGGGGSGAVTLNLDTTKIPQYSVFNAFAAGASFTSGTTATLTAKNTGTGDGLDVTTGTGYGGYFSNNATYAATVYAVNSGNGNAGNFNNNSSSRVTLAATNASTDGGAIGVYGNVTNGDAVYGISTAGTGVYGISTSGYGVYGTSTTGSAGTFVNVSKTSPGLYGSSESNDVKAVGIYGTAPNGTGISGNTTTGTGVSGSTTTGVGLSGSATGGYAVRGLATTGIGGIFSNNSTTNETVYGYNGGGGNAGYFENVSPSHVALAGVNDSTDAAAIGTYGSVSNGDGVYGISPSGTGVVGTTTTGTGAYGASTSGTGVAGKSQSQYGAAGYSQTGIGVYGELGFPSSQFGGQDILSGVWGDAGDNGALPTNYYPVGVIGSADDGAGGAFINNSQSYYSLVAVNKSGGSTHNFFRTFVASSPNGTCGIGGAGDLTCTGQVKSIVTTASARQVETYSVQSSENWLEDYGSGTLENGHAVIHLDPAFLDAVNAGVAYHVFLTPKGDAQTLFVTNETATGFEVRESGHGASSIAFDYRIVAKRRGLESQRLQDVTERVHAEIAGVQRILRKPVVAGPSTAPAN